MISDGGWLLVVNATFRSFVVYTNTFLLLWMRAYLEDAVDENCVLERIGRFVKKPWHSGIVTQMLRIFDVSQT